MPYFALADRQIPIVIRKRRGARNFVLRYQARGDQLTLSLPPRISRAQGLTFVESKRGWIERQVARAPEPVLLTDGETIPIFGAPHRICHAGGRGLVEIVDGRTLRVPGDPAFIARRVRTWLTAQVRGQITARAAAHTRAIGKTAGKIRLRDTRSRWGSCSARGDLSFSWRLVFTPPEVLDYVVAHEVAHLVEMNHSPAFWRIVAQLCPNWKAHRAWLAAHGHALHRYG